MPDEGQPKQDDRQLDFKMDFRLRMVELHLLAISSVGVLLVLGAFQPPKTLSPITLDLILRLISIATVAVALLLFVAGALGFTNLIVWNFPGEPDRMTKPQPKNKDMAFLLYFRIGLILLVLGIAFALSSRSFTQA